MMATIETYVRRGRRTVRQWVADPRVRLGCKILGYFLGGVLLSGASLASVPQPLTLGLLLALQGWPAAVLAAGGCAGYWFFWGSSGYQGMLWMGSGLAVALALGGRKVLREAPLLLCSIAGFLVSASGLAFQIWLNDVTPVPVYLLRVALAAASTALFAAVRDRKDPVADWLAEGVAVLALAQVSPFPGFSLGYVGAGVLAASGAFPAAALAGLALDLARITETPMTAVLCLSYLTRFIPRGARWIRFAAPGAVYLAIMGLRGNYDLMPAVGLAIGGGLAAALPPRPEIVHRRGETGLAQVRLEMMAGVLSQTQQLLLESPKIPIDENALASRARERACGSCPCRKTCRERLNPLSAQLLHRPLLDNSSLPIACKKPGRLVQELRRTQEQLRAIRADRDRQSEYRTAVVQQYQFLASFLQQLSDELPRKAERLRTQFEPEIAFSTAGKETANGDRCMWFSGPQCRYYVLLCDGMGTGLGAAQEGQTAAGLLRQMLGAGFPAEFALRSLNSLLALRGGSGAVTVDLAEIRLDSGKVTLYKWGAAPSLVLRDGAAERIGTAGPPPGLSILDGREMVERLSLRRGEVLILVSDGVDADAALRRVGEEFAQPPGDLAAMVLDAGARESQDDATAVAVCLKPVALST